MLLAVAAVAAAAGAVTELHIRMGDIGLAANGTAVVIGHSNLHLHGLPAAGVKGDRSAVCGGCLGFLLSAQFDPPAHGEQIYNILTEEQEVVGKGDEGEQIIGDIAYGGEIGDIVKCQNQVDQSKDPCFHRDDEEQEESGIRIQRGIADEHTQIQVIHIGRTAEEHTEGIHQYHAGKIEQIKAESSPGDLHSPSQRIVAEQADGGEQNVAGIVGKHIGKQTPNLTLQNCLAVKAENRIQDAALVEHTHDVYKGTAKRNKQHQIWDTLGTVLVAEPFETVAEILQISQLLNFSDSIIPVFNGNVHR